MFDTLVIWCKSRRYLPPPRDFGLRAAPEDVAPEGGRLPLVHHNQAAGRDRADHRLNWRKKWEKVIIRS